MTLSEKESKGAVAVLGTARDDFVIRALGELRGQGFSVSAVVKAERAERIRDAGFATHTFRGEISLGSLSLLGALRKICPDLIVVVVGDQFQHMNVMRALDFWIRLGALRKVDVCVSYSFDPGRLERWRGDTPVVKQVNAPMEIISAKNRGIERYNIVEAVWGRDYIDFFLNTHLPSLLAPGNLPALAADADCAYIVYTSSDDAEKIAGNKFFKEAGRFVRTEIITADHLFQKGGHSTPISILLMTQCHRMAVEAAAARAAALIFPAADTVVSNGALKRVDEIARSGKRVVLTTGLRFCKETLAPRLASLFADSDGIISAGPRELMEASFSHLHPLMQTFFIDSDKFNQAPVNLFRPINGQGLIVHSLYLHPLMIYPRNRSAAPYGAFDTDFLLGACPDYDDYHVVTDSDELAVIELSERSKGQDQIKPGRFDLLAFAKFIKRRGNTIHHRLLRETIRIHHKDLSPEWKSAEKKAVRLVKKGLALKTLAGVMIPSTV